MWPVKKNMYKEKLKAVTIPPVSRSVLFKYKKEEVEELPTLSAPHIHSTLPSPATLETNVDETSGPKIRKG